MVIKQLDLQSFGKFNDRKIDLVEGINLIYGKNENGKSTIKDFVEIILASFSGKNLSNQYAKEINKYKPWHSENEYCGRIVIEDESEVCLEKNFNDIKKLNVYYPDNTDEMVEEVYLDRIRSLGLIGISDMKGAKGRDLIADIISQIADVKKSNLNGISYSEIMNKIEQDIKALLENEDYIHASTEIPQTEEQIKLLSSNSSRMKELMGMLKKCEIEIKDIGSKVNHFNEMKHNAIIEGHKNKYNQILELNEEIKRDKITLERLELVTDLDNKEIKEFIELKEIVERKRQEIKDLQDKLHDIKNEVIEGVPNLDEGLINQLKIKEIREKLARYINTYKATEKDLEYVQQQIDKYNALVNSTVDPVQNTKQYEPMSQNSLMILDKDYYKYVNTLEWKNHLEANNELGEFVEEDKVEIKRLKRRSNIIIPIPILSMLAIIYSMTSFMYDSVQLYKLGVALGGAMFFCYFVFIRMWLRKQAVELQLRVDLAHEKHSKNEKLIKNYNQKLAGLLAKYQCETQEEFYDYYKAVAPVKDQAVSRIEERLQTLREEEFKFNAKKRVVIQNIDDIINSNLVDEAFSERVNEIDEYLNTVSFDNHDKEEKIKTINSKITELVADLKGYEVKLMSHVISKNSLENELDSIEDKKALKHQTEINIKNMDETKRTLLDKKSEETFEKIYKDVIEGDFTSLDFSVNTEFDQAIRDAKDREINLLEEINNIKDKILACSDKHVGYKRNVKMYDHYKNIVDSIDKQLNLLKLMKQKIENGSNTVSKTYSNQIINKMNDILFNVTGNYNDMKISDDMRVYFKEAITEEWIDINNLSLGTIDQAYFALRVGLTDSIKSNINLPIILDDSFVQYDRNRLERILVELSKMQRQVIILSCHLREKELFDQNGIDYNYIELTS